MLDSTVVGNMQGFIFWVWVCSEAVGVRTALMCSLGHRKPTSSSCWQPPALTEEDGQHGCVPPGGQSRGSPCHHVAELASVGHMGLLQSLVDTIRIVGRQETQKPGT